MPDYHHGYVVYKVRASTKIWFLVLRLGAWPDRGRYHLIRSVFFSSQYCIVLILTLFRVSTYQGWANRGLEDYVHRSWYHYVHNRLMDILLPTRYTDEGWIP